MLFSNRVLSLVLMVLLPAAISCSNPDKTYEQAKECISQKDYKNAIPLLLKVRKVKPEVLDLLALCYWNNGDQKSSLSYVDSALVFDSSAEYSNCILINRSANDESKYETTISLIERFTNVHNEYQAAFDSLLKASKNHRLKNYLTGKSDLDSVVERLNAGLFKYFLFNAKAKVQKSVENGNIVGYSCTSNGLPYWYYFEIDGNRKVKRVLYTSLLVPKNMNSVNFVATGVVSLLKALNTDITKDMAMDVISSPIFELKEYSSESSSSPSISKRLERLEENDTGLDGYIKWWTEAEEVSEFFFIPGHLSMVPNTCALEVKYNF